MHSFIAEQRLIRQLCPPQVAVAAGSLEETPDPLWSDEERAVENALEARRHEFALGRTYARRALALLGYDPVAIPRGSDRAPVWPVDVVGTISHAAGLVCAAVARKDQIRALGVDVESRDRPLDRRLDRFIRTDVERQRPLAGSQFGELDLLRLHFSAKEAVHKCIAPMYGITLGFQDVQLHLDMGDGAFRVEAVGTWSGKPELDAIEGRVAMTSRFIIATAVIAAVPLYERRTSP